MWSFPASTQSPEIYLALESGDLDLPINMSGMGHGEQKCLRDLIAIPINQQKPLFAELLQPLIAGMQSMKMPGDAAHLTVLRHAGKVQRPLILCPCLVQDNIAVGQFLGIVDTLFFLS